MNFNEKIQVFPIDNHQNMYFSSIRITNIDTNYGGTGDLSLIMCAADFDIFGIVGNIEQNFRVPTKHHSYIF